MTRIRTAPALGHWRKRKPPTHLAGTDLQGVVVTRHAYDQAWFVRCEKGHEYPVLRAVIEKRRDRGARLECRDCKQGETT